MVEPWIAIDDRQESVYYADLKLLKHRPNESPEIMGRPVQSEDAVEAFKREICDAALGIVSDQGVDALTFRTLASMLGCSHTRVHGYFRDKSDVLEGVRQVAFEQFAESLDAITEPVGPPEERIRACGKAYFEFAHENRDVFYLMFNSFDPDRRPRNTSEEKAWVYIRQAIDELFCDGAAPGEAEMLAHVFWASIHGITMLSLSGNVAADVCTEDLLLRAHESLIRGVEIQPKTPPSNPQG